MTTGIVSPLIPKQRYITLATPGFVPVASPGVCAITGAGRPMKFNEQEGFGMNGGRLSPIGFKFVHFEVEIRIWEAEHWVQWELFELMLDVPLFVPGGPAFTLGIGHPILKNVGIDKCCLEDPGQWECNDTGLWSRSLKMIKWMPPQDYFPTLKEGVPPTGVTAVPMTAQQRLNASLDAENAALRARAGVPGAPQDLLR